MINYKNDLNSAQYLAATTLDGPLLVIAGAGTGKTRTIVYRLARLVEAGVPASSILLLTFTRKAARQMLDRARLLMGQRGMGDLYDDPHSASYVSHDLSAVQGGTFHSFAYSVLRIFQPAGYAPNISVMDSHDILAALQHCREGLKAGKGDRSFPKNQTIIGLISKSRNKEVSLEDVIRRDASHLEIHAKAIADINQAYAAYKRGKNMMDYDDLLFCAEEVLLTDPQALGWCRSRHRYLMVDEYQDTNPVQARTATLVAGCDPCRTDRDPNFKGNIMVVGDDAQSIYAFRGADVRNILHFPDLFPDCPVIRLEQNYRSTQPVLNLCNAVLEHATEGFAKDLFTFDQERGERPKPNVIRPLSDRSEAALVSARILELLRHYPAQEIAVLFRAGFHSYAVEVALNKLGLRFRKYGGLRYTDAAHVKDAMSFVRLVLNPLDFAAFSRMAGLSKGVGAKTCLKIYEQALSGNADCMAKSVARFPELASDIAFLDSVRQRPLRPVDLMEAVVEQYAPRMQLIYPDDYPSRMQGLEQLLRISASYSELDLLVADLSLEDPEDHQHADDAIVLSTIHSSKGLEWSAVLILDLVEDRFPSRHAHVRPEEYEEERRLMYVACTRAKDSLDLYVPASVYDKSSGGNIPASPSPFVRELKPSLYNEWQESYVGGLVEKSKLSAAQPRQPTASPDAPLTTVGRKTFPSDQRPQADDHGDSPSFTQDERGVIGLGEAPPETPGGCGYCRHKVFGRGKIVQHLPPDKVRVNFPGIGLKVIMSAYVAMEE